MNETSERRSKSKGAVRSTYFCESCGGKFRLESSFLKHKNLYPFKHKLYDCCNKIEEDLKSHECKRRKRKLVCEVDVMEEISFRCKKLNKRLKTVKKIKTEGNEFKNDDEYLYVDIYADSLKETNDIKSEPENLDVCANKDEIKKEVDDDKEADAEEPDQFDELFRRQKRSYKRRTETEKQESEKKKIYKCSECSKSFTRSCGLGYHRRVVHEKHGKFKCQTCEEVFESSDSYYKHVFMHGPQDKVVCKGCRKSFDSLKLYYVHAKQNPGIHCFLCKLCLRKFPSELLLEQHVCICTNGQPMLCACGRKFTRYQDVIIHSKGTKPFHCCCCPHLSSSLTAYLRHMRKHSKQKFYECKECNLSFAVIDFFNIHNRKYHSGTVTESVEACEKLVSFKCTQCDFKFETKEELKKHIAQHERVNCPDCGKSLKRNRLESHRNTHKSSASLCPLCGKLFETRFKLTQHVITTHNNEPVKCAICGKVLKTKKILNEHMKTHMKTEVGLRVPQAICPMCGLGLAQKGSLARHILLMHEKHKLVPCDKTYTCQECSEVLPNKGKYYSHRRMHRAMVDRFPCEICGRQFNKKQNLRRHMYLLHDAKRVMEDPIYGCEICTRSFREKKNLRRHYKMVHKWSDDVNS